MAVDVHQDADEPLDILFVCTANVCRSPMAELVLRRELARAADPALGAWRVASAGVDAKVGAPIHPHAATVLGEIGVEVGETAARQMTSKMIERSTLVLAATRWHRSLVVEESPRAVRRVFTIRQFARMCVAGARGAEIVPEGTVDALVETALKGRTMLQPTGEDDGIEDPVLGDLAQFRVCLDLIAVSIDWMLSPFIGD